MQKAVPAGVGAMAALLGADMAQAIEICKEAAPVPETGKLEVVQPANDNGGGQVVISGHRTAIERAIEVARTKNVKRAMLLPVSAPFHCSLMAPAADAMAEALEGTPPKAPLVPLVANVSAKRESEPGRIRSLLVEQVTATVRWRESVMAMTDMGVDRYIELGAGKVLTGLNKRIAPDASGISVGTPAEIEALLKSL
jgi:[acyl-carrier-protein] S-malonyltransferase